MRLIVAIISVCFYCSVSLAAPLEEFYILPMGQGNGQLVVYNTDQPGHKVGVLYDLGSKSLQLHPKFTRRDKWNLNFIPKQPEKPSISKRVFHFKAVEQNTPDRASTAVIKVTTPDTTERKVGESQRRAIKEDLQKFIKSLLDNLNHLILFLSHTDVDHINYISEATIPDDLKITAFLCGDWFGDSCDAYVTMKLTTFQRTSLRSQSLYTQLLG